MAEGLKVVKKTFDEIVREQKDQESKGTEDKESTVPGLDCFEFTWNKTHPLRNTYTKLRKEMYAKYDCLSHENVDLRMLVDEVIILKTQLIGVSRMTLDGKGPKNLAYRVREHQKKVLELMQVLMKYTRKEPEKELKKTTVNKGKKVANDLKKHLPEELRAQVSRAFKETLANRHIMGENDEPPFDGTDDE